MSQPGPSHRNDEEMREEDEKNELNQEKRGNELNDEDEDEEWEEQTCIVEINGILDAQAVQEAIKDNLVTVRNAATNKPILQVNNSLYMGNWERCLGTDLIFKAKDGQLEFIATSDKMLKTEKALLSAPVNQEDERMGTRELSPPPMNQNCLSKKKDPSTPKQSRQRKPKESSSPGIPVIDMDAEPIE
ncbi:hypothetical protein WR25_18596 [Diploscapter pachys]|uniref:Transcription factor TFIIIC triple barrel domain-containing protein n=1 Tax=Diploscapter pachys TaxID=2018661 RepID=A0A2A2LMH4_9BILA|nr:hypothetical protein WR25_18596 [Diploscapter pachys]